jgi:hypothetical protein
MSPEGATEIISGQLLPSPLHSRARFKAIEVAVREQPLLVDGVDFTALSFA